MACCDCCEQTGACCNAGACAQETCADCEENGGSFQGVGTECEGEDECPCDPPADPTLCERCVDGEAESFCPEAKPYCCGGVCQEEPCPVGACCDDQGGCSETTEAECEGVWHEGVSCEGIDCTLGCCSGYEAGDPYKIINGCIVPWCIRGVPVGVQCVECDPDGPEPIGPTAQCEGGQPTTATVTGAGFESDLNSGDPADDAELESLMNAAYVLDLDCAGAGEETFDYPNWTVQVNVGLGHTRVATIYAQSKPPNNWFANMTYTAAGVDNSTECGGFQYECDPFSASYGDAGWQDAGSQGTNFTGASLDVT